MPSTSVFLALPGGPGVAPNMPVELPRDFASICYMLEQPLYIGASHKSGINTVADVIRMAKEKPGEVSYAATGRGRLTHLTMELLQSRAGIKLQLVPYAGGPAQAMNDVMSGRVPLVLDGYAGLAPAIKGDLIKGLASTALKRPPGFENLPTVAETVPDFFVGAWTILLAPKGTPEAILRKVHNDMRIVLDDPEIRAKLALNGGFVRHMTPESSPPSCRTSRRPGGRSWNRSRKTRRSRSVAVGTRVSPRAPRTEPYVRLSRIRLPPRVDNGKAVARPRMEDRRLWEPGIHELRHPHPGHPMLLTATS